jgi:hypothetical protein
MNKPVSQLDYEVIRIALEAAHKFIADGLTPDEAAKRATPGAWSPYRQEVELALNNLPQTKTV